MKKYLISGFNTVQDVKLEVGTYTLVAYVKSMHGDVYTFALGNGTDWDEFSIDVIQGQLCKVWLTFTIDKKATKFKPIANNFTEELPVYVADLQLTRGNIPVESGASPFDIDQILNDLHDEIDAIEDFTEGAFLDGLLSREEKTQLRASLDSIGSIVESVKGSYDKLLDNPFIHENTMDSITARYYAFIASWISDGDPRGLKPVILWIVNGDNIVDQNERDEKDRALNAFNLALYEYNQAEKEVYNDVGENSIAPIIDENGMWAFWSTELQEFIPSEFTAEGDDGHSPYIDVLTGTWWEWNPEIGEFKDTFIKAEGVKGDKGEDGYTPIKGTDYFDGKDGQDGTSQYLWIRYSQNSNGNPFVTDPTNAKYIGIATTLTNSPPSNYLSYDWSLIKGTDGIAGEKGSDGQTSYLHIKYSNDGTTFTANNGETVGAWIGTYVDFVEADSMVFSRYTWNKVKGEDGKDGKDGVDGEPPKILNGYPKTQYAIGDSKTIYPTSGWGEDIIDVTESKPYLWSRQEIKYDSGYTLYTGYLMLTNITPVAYMAGEWDLRVAYTRNDKSYPIVTYKKGTNNRPLYYYPKKEGVIGYEYFVTPPTEPSSGWYKNGDIVWYEDTGEDYPVILGLYKANKDTRFNPYSNDWDNVTADYAPNGVEGQKLWEFADGVELIITDALMANFGKIASAVFSGDHMISQFGEDQLGNQTSNYKDFGKVDENENPLFTPNIDIDFSRGVLKALNAEISGTINATSGSIGGFAIGQGRIGVIQSGGTPLNTGLSLYNEFIKFSNSSANVFLGTNILPGSSGTTALARLQSTGTGDTTKYGMIIDISGANSYFGGNNNVAIDIISGVINGFRWQVKARNMSSGTYLFGRETEAVLYLSSSNCKVSLPLHPQIGELKIVTRLNNYNLMISGNGNEMLGEGRGKTTTFRFGPDCTIKSMTLMFRWDGDCWIYNSF